jgi:hypothetical protein
MRQFYLPLFSLLSLSSFISCQRNGIPATQSGDWAAEAQLNGPARSEAVSFVIDNYAYVGTGWDGLNTRFNDFWKYDPVNNVWVQIISMPDAGRSSAVGMSINGRGYVGTGYDGYNYLNDFYELDPVANVWTLRAPYPGSPRYESVAFAIGDFGYVGTGFDGANAQKDFYQYDPGQDSWSYLGFSGNKRYSAVAFVYKNKGYVVTGVNSGVMQTDFWVFDPSESATKWTELRHISNYSTDSYDDGYTTIVRMNGSAFVIGDMAYISTGENNGYNTNTWVYNFASDLWGVKTPFEGPATTGAVGFSLSSTTGGGGYIVTGRSSPGQAGASDYLWQFFPAKTVNPNDN